MYAYKVSLKLFFYEYVWINEFPIIQIIGCVVQLHDEINFIGNEAQDGGALYIITFGQLKIFSNTDVKFEGNEGQWVPYTWKTCLYRGGCSCTHACCIL